MRIALMKHLVSIANSSPLAFFDSVCRQIPQDFSGGGKQKQKRRRTIKRKNIGNLATQLV